MLRFLLLRVGRALIAMVLCLTAVFVLLRIAGDPASMLLPSETPPDVKAEYRAQWGLDRPLPEQYALYFRGVLAGDLGRSLADHQPVVDILAECLPRTLLLGLCALACAVLVGMPLGLIAATRHNSGLDRFVMGVAVLGYSVPVFFLGILFIFVFALKLRVLPAAGSETPWHLIMPALTLGLPLAGRLARFTRTALLEVLGQAYVRTARAKGVKRLQVILAHALPNAAPPLLMALGIEIGHILAGAAVTETIFAWPGLGRLLVESVAFRDLPVAQGVILLVTMIMVLANFSVDLLHGMLDPRVGLQGEGRR